MEKPMRAHDQSHAEKVPLPFLLAAGGLIALTLFLVSVSRLTRSSDTLLTAADAVAARNLRFVDQPNGGIAVYSAKDGRLIETVAPGTNGFLRGTLRALVRERHQSGIGAEQPFRLIERVDGSLILYDPATERRIDLRAFGPTNAGAFAGLLASGSKDQ
jgi:putative photosynthetic complex assembly protein